MTLKITLPYLETPELYNTTAGAGKSSEGFYSGGLYCAVNLQLHQGESLEQNATVSFCNVEIPDIPTPILIFELFFFCTNLCGALIRNKNPCSGRSVCGE